MSFTITNLACARGGIPVLEELFLSVDAGQTLLLRGPNGIGKTTLLRTIAGLQPAVRGTISPGAEQIAYAAHADGLKATLTVTENLRFWADVFGCDDIEPALVAFNLTELRTRLAHNLSAGQKRRLGLARLLVTGRTIWALDEPTVSLDQESVGLFAAAVEEHCRAGGITLIATHVDLGITAETLDLTQFRAERRSDDRFDEAFL